jgi:hypothetical protein
MEVDLRLRWEVRVGVLVGVWDGVDVDLVDLDCVDLW